MRRRLSPHTAILALSGLILLTAARYAAAQGTQADYDRALRVREETANKVFRDRVRPQWFADNTRFWYRNDLAAGLREGLNQRQRR